MNEKLQELTNKIYQEGLEKGKIEAREIVSKARAEAEEIVRSAKKTASEIIEKAEKDTAETKKNTESELSMSTKQAYTAIKQKITDIIVENAVTEALSHTLDQQDFMKSLMLKMAENWDEIESEGKDLMFFLSEKDHKELGTFLKNIVAQKINGGLEVRIEENIQSGFKLGPIDGSYKLSFTDKDFSRFFKQYLRPRTRKFLAEE